MAVAAVYTERFADAEHVLAVALATAERLGGASGHMDDVRRVIDWLEQGVARLPCRWPRIVAATGRAALAEAGGDLDAAEQHYEAALVLHEYIELPLEYVETLLGYGTFLRRRGPPLAIAGQLSLSTSTIEYHLAQVYTKLGINSRRQLMTGITTFEWRRQDWYES